MRVAVFAILFAAAPAFADELSPSQSACDAKKLGAREMAECLRAAADKGDRDLAAEMETATKSIDGRQGLLGPQKARWRHSLADAQSAWLAWRDTECQDVAPFEAGIGAKGGVSPDLACRIDHDARRIADLKARYP